MKLKTEMVDGCVHALGCCIDADCVLPREALELEHDAMAAHALLQAVDEWAALSVAEMINYDANDWIKQRAAEILAGWLGEDRG